MSTLGDAADVNHVIKFLPRDLPQLRRRIVEAVPTVDSQMLQRVYNHLPVKMEPTEGSETSAFKIQTPGKYPKEYLPHLQHGESLKTKIKFSLSYKSK
jgi:hypothetical protein